MLLSDEAKRLARAATAKQARGSPGAGNMLEDGVSGAGAGGRSFEALMNSPWKASAALGPSSKPSANFTCISFK